jgi:hypothetical protein
MAIEVALVVGSESDVAAQPTAIAGVVPINAAVAGAPNAVAAAAAGSHGVVAMLIAKLISIVSVTLARGTLLPFRIRPPLLGSPVGSQLIERCRLAAVKKRVV